MDEMIQDTMPRDGESLDQRIARLVEKYGAGNVVVFGENVFIDEED